MQAFVEYAAEMNYSVSVPISIHLDHFMHPSPVKCAFDSIMVDRFIFDEAENITYVQSMVERAKRKGMTGEDLNWATWKW